LTKAFAFPSLHFTSQFYLPSRFADYVLLIIHHYQFDSVGNEAIEYIPEKAKFRWFDQLEIVRYHKFLRMKVIAQLRN
jgi:hypothetical protein